MHISEILHLGAFASSSICTDAITLLQLLAGHAYMPNLTSLRLSPDERVIITKDALTSAELA